MAKIAFDLDGVLADFDLGWVTKHNETCDQECGLVPQMPQQYDTLHELAHHQTRRLFWEWFYGKVGWASLPLIDGAAAGLLQVNFEFHHDIAIVTSRPADTTAPTVRWLRHNIPEMSNTGWPLTFAGPDKWTMGVHFDAWVDDDPNVLLRLAMDTRCLPIRFDQPWNRHLDGHGEMVHVSGWPALLDLLNPEKQWV